MWARDSWGGSDAPGRACGLAFAKTGDPNNARIPTWKKYDLTDRATMIFDTNSRMENDPRRGERELIETVPYLKPGT